MDKNLQRYNALQRRLDLLERVHLDGKNAVGPLVSPSAMAHFSSTKQRLSVSNETFRAVKRRSLSRPTTYTSRKSTMTLWNPAYAT